MISSIKLWFASKLMRVALSLSHGATAESASDSRAVQHTPVEAFAGTMLEPDARINALTIAAALDDYNRDPDGAKAAYVAVGRNMHLLRTPLAAVVKMGVDSGLSAEATGEATYINCFLIGMYLERRIARADVQ